MGRVTAIFPAVAGVIALDYRRHLRLALWGDQRLELLELVQLLFQHLDLFDLLPVSRRASFRSI